MLYYVLSIVHIKTNVYLCGVMISRDYHRRVLAAGGFFISKFLKTIYKQFNFYSK